MMNDSLRRPRGASACAVRSYRRAGLVAILAISLGCLGASPALAHFGERTDSLWGFVSRSDVVVIGRVAESRVHEEKGHTTLPGAVRLEVEPSQPLGVASWRTKSAVRDIRLKKL